MRAKNAKTIEIPVNHELLKQIMEDLNLFLEVFILTAEFNLLRSKLRLLHQTLPNGQDKSAVRGLLTYLKRWPKKKIWLKVSTILQRFLKTSQIGTLRNKRIIENNRFVGQSDILNILNKPNPLAIKEE